MRERKTVGIRVVVSIAVIAILYSCVHEIPLPVQTPNENPGGGNNNGDHTGGTLPGCSADTVYFEQQVLPLVTSLCGKSGCHGTLQPHEFQLIYTSKASSYSAIKQRFSSGSRLAKALNEMGEQEISGYTAPSSEQLAVLTKWISQGQLNNSCNACDSTKFLFSVNVSPIIKFYCSGCHPAPGSETIPNLSTYAAIQSEINTHPGRLLGSIEWTSPYNTPTKQMPQGSNKLSDCERAVIRRWIEGGALNN